MKFLALSVLLTGCTSSAHIAPDYGDAYTQVFTMQADLSRESVSTDNLWLSGTEAEQIRIRVEEAATDQAAPTITLGS
ncbi:MAG: hypothetical protein JXX28_04830 [Deltaproteobacteria bacterium]|nr:hypothetical protein [Deltaproteobacteria bacterium]